MPRVGSSSSSTRGLRHSSRASSTFCWLPPESSETFWLGPVRLDPQPLRRRRRRSRPACVAVDEPAAGQLRQRGQADVVADRQLRDDALGLAVLGQEGDPVADPRGRGLAGAAAGRRSRRRRSPAAARRRPPSPSRCGPSRADPASPTTSPGRTTSDTSSSTSRRLRWVAFSTGSASATGGRPASWVSRCPPPARRRRGRASGRSAAAGWSRRSAPVQTSWPSRSTVIVSQAWKTSSSLWET